MTTRSQAKKAGEHIPLKVPDTNESPVVDRESLKQMQRELKEILGERRCSCERPS